MLGRGEGRGPKEGRGGAEGPPRRGSKPRVGPSRDDPLNQSFSMSLENLETWDLDAPLSIPGGLMGMGYMGMGVGVGMGVSVTVRRAPAASTPVCDTPPLESLPCSPVGGSRRGSCSSSPTGERPFPQGEPPRTCWGPDTPRVWVPIRGAPRMPGAMPPLRPRAPHPAALGPKWRLFKRRTCPDLLKTRSTDNLFR